MMSELLKKIEADFVEAIKKRDDLKISTLRLLKSSLHNLEIEKRIDLSNEDIYVLLQKEIKQRQDSIIEFKKGNRKDLVKKEEGEIAILKPYLPEALSDTEVDKLIEEAISKTGAKSSRDAGKVMGFLAAKVKSRVDGKTLFQKISERLR